MFVVGLTGGIGSGKTAASDLLSQKGISIVDADHCARIVVQPDRPALNKIRSFFGDTIIDDNGLLNRPLLRQLIFSDPAQKIWLERLLHPLIGEEILLQLNQVTSPYAVLASPLLVESGQRNLCDRVLVIDIPVELQIQRTCQRDNNDEQQVRKIIASQASREQRLATADDVIKNNKSFSFLEQEIERLHKNYLQLVKKKT